MTDIVALLMGSAVVILGIAVNYLSNELENQRTVNVEVVRTLNRLADIVIDLQRQFEKGGESNESRQLQPRSQ